MTDMIGISSADINKSTYQNACESGANRQTVRYALRSHPTAANVLVIISQKLDSRGFEVFSSDLWRIRTIFGVNRCRNLTPQQKRVLVSTPIFYRKINGFLTCVQVRNTGQIFANSAKNNTNKKWRLKFEPSIAIK